jgi:hypothetical protein
VLERAGLMTQRQEGRVRRCMLVAEPLREADRWLGDYRRFWDARLDRTARAGTAGSTSSSTCFRAEASVAMRRSAPLAAGRAEAQGDGLLTR